MSWTRSAVLRAGVTGAAGAALVLSVLPPIEQPAASAATPQATETVLAIAAGELPIPTGPTAEQVAAAEAARDRQSASRAQDRADAAQREKQAQKRRQAKQAEKRAAERAARESRREAPPATPASVIGERYTTVALNVRTEPGGPVVTTLAAGATVSVTDRTNGGWRQIRYDGASRWVSDQYLSTQKPAAPTTPSASGSSGQSTSSTPSGAACAHGSGIEGGLGANARAVYRAVCARYPQVTGYGGYRPDGGNHGSGRAVDIMVSGQLGWDIANWVRANAGALGVSEVIYAQRIWTVQRSGEGWRGMSDRGSATANHYDHVHVSTY